MWVYPAPQPSVYVPGLGTGGLACGGVAYSSLRPCLVSPCVVAGGVSAPDSSSTIRRWPNARLLARSGASTPMLLARSRHASVPSLERYARLGVDAVAWHVAHRGPVFVMSRASPFWSSRSQKRSSLATSRRKSLRARSGALCPRKAYSSGGAPELTCTHTGCGQLVGVVGPEVVRILLYLGRLSRGIRLSGPAATARNSRTDSGTGQHAATAGRQLAVRAHRRWPSALAGRSHLAQVVTRVLGPPAEAGSGPQDRVGAPESGGVHTVCETRVRARATRSPVGTLGGASVRGGL